MELVTLITSYPDVLRFRDSWGQSMESIHSYPIFADLICDTFIGVQGDVCLGSWLLTA